MKKAWVLLVFFLFNSLAMAQPSPLTKILTSRPLWGRDYPDALASLRAWSRINDHMVAIFPNQLVGSTPYNAPEEAERTAQALGQALKAPRPKPNVAFESLLKEALRRPPPFQPQVLTRFEDDSTRVALTAPSLQFLAPALSIQQVQRVIGTPEKTSTQLIQGRGDRRPILLTLHSYAGGMIVFVESDLSARPDLIDRVVLDVDGVAKEVFKGGQ
jgi:hypothetical protein